MQTKEQQFIILSSLGLKVGDEIKINNENFNFILKIVEYKDCVILKGIQASTIDLTYDIVILFVFDWEKIKNPTKEELKQ